MNIFGDIRGNRPVIYNPAAIHDIRLSGIDPMYCDIRGLAVSPDGEIFLADVANDLIHVFSAEYEKRSDFTVIGPQDVCVTPGRDVAVACWDKIQLYTNGKMKWEVDTQVYSWMGMAISITTDRYDRFYVALNGGTTYSTLTHAYNNCPGIVVLDPSGGFLSHIMDEHLECPWCVAVHPLSHRLYVTDRDRDQIIVFSADGEYEYRVTEVKSPEYLSFRADGLLAVCRQQSDNQSWEVCLLQDDRCLQTLSLAAGSGRPCCAFMPGGELLVCHKNGRFRVFTTIQ